MLGETKLVISYFQKMTLRSKILKIIHTLFLNRVECKLFWNICVNYFGIFLANVIC